ncbi:MAG: ABC transporter permease [Streptosporangiaceae bacterium]
MSARTPASPGARRAIPDISDRRAPGLGGLNLTILALEIRRLTRNRRTLIFAIILPVVLFLSFGLNSAYAGERAGQGNVSAFIMISISLYGAVIATTAGGAMVSIERAAGWSRQLRLTPLTPAAYIMVKVLTAMVLGLVSVVVVFAVGRATGKPELPGDLWFATAAAVWIGSAVFAAFGLFLGYLLPTENVMQFLGLILALLSLAGGLFIPLTQFPELVATIARGTPLYGLNELVHASMLNQGVHLAWVANVVIWLAIFVGGSVWRFRNDTGRV